MDEEPSAGNADWALESHRLLVWGFEQGESEVHEAHYDGLVELRNYLSEEAIARGGRASDWWRFIERIVGYASPEGRELDNLELGFARARSVCAELFGDSEEGAMRAAGVTTGELLFSRGEGHPGRLAQPGRWHRYRAVVVELAEAEIPSAAAQAASVSDPGAEGGEGSERVAELAVEELSEDIVGDLVNNAGNLSTAIDVVVNLGPFGETISSLNFVTGLISGVTSSFVEWANALQLPRRVAFTFGAPYGFVYSGRGRAVPEYPLSSPNAVTVAGWRQGTSRGFDAFSSLLRRYCEETFTEARAGAPGVRYGFTVRGDCREFYSDQAEAAYQAFLEYIDVDANAESLLNEIFLGVVPLVNYGPMEDRVMGYILQLEPPAWHRG